jgi:hypothetical protein
LSNGKQMIINTVLLVLVRTARIFFHQSGSRTHDNCWTTLSRRRDFNAEVTTCGRPSNAQLTSTVFNIHRYHSTNSFHWYNFLFFAHLSTCIVQEKSHYTILHSFFDNCMDSLSLVQQTNVVKRYRKWKISAFFIYYFDFLTVQFWFEN